MTQRKGFILTQLEKELGMVHTYSFIIVQVLFECFPGLSMSRFIGNIRILLVARAFIIFGTMSFPVSQAHPTEIMLTVAALHVITTTVFFDTDMTFGALRTGKEKLNKAGSMKDIDLIVSLQSV